MDLQRPILILGTCVMLAGWQAASGIDDDIYGEGNWPEYKEGPAWQEQKVTLPPYPDRDNLVEVELSLKNFPFTLWVDGRSLQVGEDRVVRYTGVLRSSSGAENVFYEGIRCSQKEYQRYAYGTEGTFKLMENSEWRPVRPLGSERYRSVLMERFLCPLPGYNREKQILRRLETGHLRRDF